MPEVVGAIWRALPFPVGHALGGDEREAMEGVTHMMSRGAEGEASVRAFIEKALWPNRPSVGVERPEEPTKGADHD